MDMIAIWNRKEIMVTDNMERLSKALSRPFRVRRWFLFHG